jgi:WD40 repeat protein
MVGRLPIGRIVFDRLSGGPEGTFDGMFALGADGVEHEIQLPGAPDFASGVWSSDGRKLLIDSYTDPVGGAVGILDDHSAQFTALAPKGLANGLDCSDWSPDDRTLVCGYGSPDKVRDGIYLVDVASGRATRLTRSQDHDTVGTAGECGGGEGRGVYSPDGRRIAYERQHCGTGPDPSSDESGSVVVIGVDGSARKAIVPLGGVRTHPGGEISWSPDGSLIAFGTQDGALSVVGTDGSGLRRIPLPPTVDGDFAYGPAWSPDGKWLLVAVGGNGSSDLYAVALDGSDAIQLTSTSLTEAYTDWGPPAS